MKKNIKHIVSLLVFGFFIFIAISSIGLTNVLPTCDELENRHSELGYYLCDPLSTEIIRQNEYKIKVVDKSGKAIPHVKVIVTSLPVLLDKLNYCDKCYGKLNNYKENAGSIVSFTDANGEISGKTAEMKYLDKRDVQLVTFWLTDSEDLYTEKFVNDRFGYNADKLQQTIILVNNLDL